MPPDEHCVNRKDVEWSEHTHGEAFTIRGKRLGAAAGSERLGCTLYELPPNRRTHPYHYHTGNEEAMYVLAGEGRLRTPSGTRTIVEGDYAAFPAGEDGAHQVINSSAEPLEYLCFSTMRTPDIVLYPDSEKVLATNRARAADDGFSEQFPLDAAVDYWDGEPDDPAAFEE